MFSFFRISESVVSFRQCKDAPGLIVKEILRLLVFIIEHIHVIAAKYFDSKIE